MSHTDDAREMSYEVRNAFEDNPGRKPHYYIAVGMWADAEMPGTESMWTYVHTVFDASLARAHASRMLAMACELEAKEAEAHGQTD